ncbi:MAG: hypothetical protein VKP72_07640 [bacterium]|nr:hypothetical protein [bacterium]
MASFHRGAALIALTAVSTSFLAGCGSLARVAPGTVGGNAVASSSAVTGEQLAAEFAESLRARGLESTVRGATVVVPVPDARMATALAASGHMPTFMASGQSPTAPAMQYDFATTVRTGKVEFTAGNFRTSIDRSSVEGPSAQIATWRLVLFAVRVVYGGVNAWVWYRGTHTGDQFKKAELVQAVLYGMISQGLIAVPYVGLFSQLVMPVIWKWVTGRDPIRPTVAELFDMVRTDIPQIAQAIGACERAAR